MQRLDKIECGQQDSNLQGVPGPARVTKDLSHWLPRPARLPCFATPACGFISSLLCAGQGVPRGRDTSHPVRFLTYSSALAVLCRLRVLNLHLDGTKSRIKVRPPSPKSPNSGYLCPVKDGFSVFIPERRKDLFNCPQPTSDAFGFNAKGLGNYVGFRPIASGLG